MVKDCYLSTKSRPALFLLLFGNPDSLPAAQRNLPAPYDFLLPPPPKHNCPPLRRCLFRQTNNSREAGRKPPSTPTRSPPKPWLRRFLSPGRAIATNAASAAGRPQT